MDDFYSPEQIFKGPTAPAEWVFAYGSNLNLEDLRHWLAHYGYPPNGVLQVLPARLPGYELVWNYYSPVRQGGAANVQPANDRCVFGALLQISAETLPGIDKKEGHPTRYSRGNHLVATEPLPNGAVTQAWLYQVQPAFRTQAPCRPTAEYLEIMLQGIAQVGLPDEWVKQVLENLPA